jgi:Uma2 family endonuclease
MAVNTIQIERKLFTVDEYERMVSAGVLDEDDRLELIEGEVLAMSPIGWLHIQIVNRLAHLFDQQLRGQAVVSVQNPIRLSRSEPQPDPAILWPEVYNRTAVPGAPDVLLLVEVADITAAYDRGIKIPLYAANGIAEVWLIDVQAQALEVYRGPASGHYRESKTFSGAQTVALQALPEVRLSVDEILGLDKPHDLRS